MCWLGKENTIMAFKTRSAALAKTHFQDLLFSDWCRKVKLQVTTRSQLISVKSVSEPEPFGHRTQRTAVFCQIFRDKTGKHDKHDNQN